VLKEQSKGEVVLELSKQLARLSVLYSIPNYTAVNASILAEWIYDNYQNELLETVMRVLNKPPDTGEKIWRLTPDTVSAWMSIELEKFYAERERQINNAKYEDVPSEWKDERLKELAETLKKVDDFVVPSLTESDIIQEGQEQPKKRNYQSPDKEYFVMMDLRSEYGRLHTDLHTGKVKDGAPSFDEFLRLNHKPK
jgi:disulfide oxidoreductase YuzD